MTNGTIQRSGLALADAHRPDLHVRTRLYSAKPATAANAAKARSP
jgi:hypothetical protein